jgi:hypothetical protein
MGHTAQAEQELCGGWIPRKWLALGDEQIFGSRHRWCIGGVWNDSSGGSSNCSGSAGGAMMSGQRRRSVRGARQNPSIAPNEQLGFGIS